MGRTRLIFALIKFRHLQKNMDPEHELTAELDFLQRSPAVFPSQYLNKNPRQTDIKYTAKHVGLKF